MKTSFYNFLSKSIWVEKHKILFSISKFLMLCCSGFYFIVVFYIIVSRINYPFELEWMEGGSLLQVIRIMSGKMLYVKPSIEFIPYIYTPLYFYISSFFALFIGPSFFPLRLVSFLSSLGSMILIFKFVYREAKSNFSGFMAVGLFVATFLLSGAWFDIARVDSLLLFFLLWTAYILYDLDQKKIFLASILVFCAFYTKQTAIIALLPFFFLILIKDRNIFLKLLLCSLVLIGGVSLLWNINSNGWFKYYVFSLSRNHTVLIGNESVTTLFNIIEPTIIAIMISLFFVKEVFHSFISKNSTGYHLTLYYLFVSLGFVGISWAGMINKGGYQNVLMPIYAWIAILFGLGLNEIIKYLERNKKYFLCLVLSIIVIYQMVLLNFSIPDQIPTEEDHRAGNLLIETIKGTRGQVFIPSSSYLAFLAGKETYLNTMALDEIIGKFGPPDSYQSEPIKNEIQTAINQRIFSEILIDRKVTFNTKKLDINYYKAGMLFDDPNVFTPVTGLANRPETIYLPSSP